MCRSPGLRRLNSDGRMKRAATWMFYAVGMVAAGYLVLYAYAAFTGNPLQPGNPIQIFRKPDAPSYSGASSIVAAQL